MNINDTQEGILYAAIHNIGMLALALSTGGKFDSRFIEVDGKIPLPNTVPEGLIALMIQQFGKKTISIINMTGGGIGSRLIIPRGSGLVS